MMQVYFERANWFGGVVLILAFLLTFLPDPQRGVLVVAGILWSLALFALYSVRAYDIYMRAYINYAFGTSPFPFVGRFPPFSWMLSIAVASGLLLPRIGQSRALRFGMLHLLVLWPALLILNEYLLWRCSYSGVGNAPVGVLQLGCTLLWFRIRERYPQA